MKKFGHIEQCTVLFILWCAYFSCYLLRSPYGIIKYEIQQSFNTTDYLLGFIDFSFSLPYSLFSIVFGYLGDIFGARLTLGCSLVGSGISNSIMGNTENIFEMYVLLFTNGAFQASCWPSTCSILSTWIYPKHRISFMAIFSTCILAGTVCGSLLTVYLQSNGGWRNVFDMPSILVVIIGIIVLFLGKPKSKRGNNVSEHLHNTNLINSGGNKVESQTFINILCTPSLIETSVSLLFIKCLKNGLKFWLPLYLGKILKFNATQSGLIPLSFEVGGLFGSVLIIIVFENLFKCNDLLICIFCSFFSTISFILLLLAPKFGIIYLLINLFIGGAMFNVTDIILCGSYPTKIGEQQSARSTVVGIMNGIGSFGNVIEGPIISGISFYLGLEYFIPFIIISSFLSFLFLLNPYYAYKKEISFSSDV